MTCGAAGRKSSRMEIKAMEAQLYPIGQAAKLCNVSPRTLRYYEERGLIKPDMITESRYRYYNAQTMRIVQVIQYLIAEGFSLEEVEQVTGDEDFSRLQQLLEKHMNRTREEIRLFHQRMDSMAAWYRLITEGKRVLDYGLNGISIRYFPTVKCISIESEIDFADPCWDANLEIEYYARSKDNGHSMVDVGGAFLFYFDSIDTRLDKRTCRVKVIQEAYPHAGTEYGTTVAEGFMGVYAYHIGSLENIDETYDRMLEWAGKHSFRLKGDCCEQRIIDIYSTPDIDRFVTKIVLPIDDGCDDLSYLEDVNNA